MYLVGKKNLDEFNKKFDTKLDKISVYKKITQLQYKIEAVKKALITQNFDNVGEEIQDYIAHEFIENIIFNKNNEYLEKLKLALHDKTKMDLMVGSFNNVNIASYNYVIRYIYLYKETKPTQTFLEINNKFYSKSYLFKNINKNILEQLKEKILIKKQPLLESCNVQFNEEYKNSVHEQYVQSYGDDVQFNKNLNDSLIKKFLEKIEIIILEGIKDNDNEDLCNLIEIMDNESIKILLYLEEERIYMYRNFFGFHDYKSFFYENLRNIFLKRTRMEIDKDYNKKNFGDKRVQNIKDYSHHKVSRDSYRKNEI